MKTRVVLMTLLVLAGTAGCRSTQPADAFTHFDRDHLTLEEINGVGLANAYDLVQAQRHSWLREKHRPLRLQDEAVAVYLDGAYMGGTETLQFLPTSNLLSLRRIRPEDTLRLLGRDHPNGAILVARYRRADS